MSGIASLVVGRAAREALRCKGGEGSVRSVRTPDMLPGSLRGLEDRSKGSVWSHRSTPGRSIGWLARRALPLKVRAWSLKPLGWRSCDQYASDQVRSIVKCRMGRVDCYGNEVETM
jgi:hypothetical protein